MDSAGLIAVSALYAVLCNMFAGAWIGSFRGRSGLGFLLGFFLGPLGWFVVLNMNDKRLKCSHCKGHIPAGALRCLHCGADRTEKAGK